MSPENSCKAVLRFAKGRGFQPIFLMKKTDKEKRQTIQVIGQLYQRWSKYCADLMPGFGQRRGAIVKVTAAALQYVMQHPECKDEIAQLTLEMQRSQAVPDAAQQEINFEGDAA